MTTTIQEIIPLDQVLQKRAHMTPRATVIFHEHSPT